MTPFSFSISSSRNIGCSSRSVSTSKACDRCRSSTVVLKHTSSFAVKASRLPPSASTLRAMSSADRLVVPLNSMCSMKCEMPFCSVVSRREPEPIQTPTDTLRTCGMTSVITRTPLPSVLISMSRKGLVGDVIAKEGKEPILVVAPLGSFQFEHLPTAPQPAEWERPPGLPYPLDWNSMSQPLVGMDLTDLREALGPDQPGYRARQIYQALYHGQAADLAQISTLPVRLRQELADRHALGLPTVDRLFESTDGTRRYLLRLADGRTVETVLMPEGERDTICISSQVGCPVDCKFCMTALMGLERSLSAGEIVGQVLLVTQENQLRQEGGRLNIVMMGQGEPLLNLPNVVKATRILLDPAGFALSPRRITVSPAGLIPQIALLGRQPPRPPASRQTPRAYPPPPAASRSPRPASSPRSPNSAANRSAPNLPSPSTPPPKSSGSNSCRLRGNIT